MLTDLWLQLKLLEAKRRVLVWDYWASKFPGHIALQRVYLRRVRDYNQASFALDAHRRKVKHGH